MRFLQSFCLAAVALTTPATAQQGEPVFACYDDMRGVMDRLITTRQIQDLMLRFGGGDEMTESQLDALDASVERLYPQDFENVATLRRIVHENGFVEELLAYWTGYTYLYAYVFYHDRGEEVVSINFRFNSDYAKLTGLF
ncbi:hypothetical protein ACN2XU_17905 [Primorskyibacter sp. 2E107]|uniref:hypothetical protein n=1 Tax=Primorskyibacter sp. 2E107 TaxID=3403458 RepID=UPI003AF72831